MKLFLLDDHALFGQGLKSMLEKREEVEICDYEGNVCNFFDRLDTNDYDILIIDINLSDNFTGFDVIKKVLSNNCKQKVVILTTYDLYMYKIKALKLGVNDYLTKSIEINELIERLNTVMEGQKFCCKKSKLEPLTPKEIEILNELTKGHTRKVIAKKFYISEKTLYNHIAHIYRKLNVINLIAAYNKAIKFGYINPVI